MRLTVQVARITLFLSLLFAPAFGFAREDDEQAPITGADTVSEVSENSAPEKKEGFDAGELIMEHISDNHEWHIVGNFAIPLPVIVKTDKGIECFSSSNFHNPQTHEWQSYTGKYYTYKLNEKGKIVVWDENLNAENENATKALFDFSFTKNVATLFIVVFLMFFVFTRVAKTYKKREGQTTKGMQSLIEPLVVFVRDDIAKTSIGPKYEKYLPFLLTIFFFIWISNLLGMIPFFPGGANFS